MTWRARSTSDRTDDWPLWYVTDDADHGTPRAALAAMEGK